MKCRIRGTCDKFWNQRMATNDKKSERGIIPLQRKVVISEDKDED